MYKVDGLEKLTESFSKTSLVGLTYYTKNFLPELIVYLVRRNKKIQIVSKTTAPNEGVLFVEEVTNFSIPMKNEDNFFAPVGDNTISFKIDTAESMEYSLKQAAKLGSEQILLSDFFSIDIESKLALVLNDEKLEKINYTDFVKKII